MDSESTPRLRREDFNRALQEFDTFIDISIEDLLAINEKASRFARLRNRESLPVSKFMTAPVISVAPATSLAEAAHLLINHRISGLPVTDEQHRLLGIITEADFLSAIGIPAQHAAQSVWHTLEAMFSHHDTVWEPSGNVEDLMVNKVIRLTPEATLHDAVEVMKQHHIKRIVVCDRKDRVAGMITRSDLVRVFFNRFITANQPSPGREK